MIATQAPVPTLDVYQAELAEPDPKTSQVSTAELRRILADDREILIDSRKRAEYEAGHIAGASNISTPAGAPVADSIAAVERLVGGDKNRPLIIYCNGQYCRQGRQLSQLLVEAGFQKVRRYQLGIQVWRALSLPVEIELGGILRIFGVDRTVVYFDARAKDEFALGSIRYAHNVPVEDAEAVGFTNAPLPRNDFNTRVVIFGRDGTQARRLADVMGRTPFQNVSYFPGTFEQLKSAIMASQPAAT